MPSGLPSIDIELIPNERVLEDEWFTLDGGRSIQIHPVTLGRFYARQWYDEHLAALPEADRALLNSAAARTGRKPHHVASATRSASTTIPSSRQ